MYYVITLYLLVGVASLAMSLAKGNNRACLGLGTIGAAIVSLAILGIDLWLIISGQHQTGFLSAASASYRLWPLGNVAFSIDSLSLFISAVIAAVSTAASVYAFGYMHDADPVSILLLNLFLMSMHLVVFSATSPAFMISWELMAITSYMLIVAGGHGDGAPKAAFIYLVMTHVSAAIMLCGFLVLQAVTGSSSFAEWAKAAPSLTPTLRGLCFCLLTVGFATKGGLIPFHVWLPRAHPEAPSYMSALMSGVMVKTAVYGLIRFGFGTLGVPAPWWGIVIGVMGLASAILGALSAQRQDDMKAVLAYSTIENMGILAMGIGLAMTAKALGSTTLVNLAMIAVGVHIVGHACFKSLLFMGAGAVQTATGTRDLESLGGLVGRMPKSSLLILIGSLGASGIPGFPGFAGEWLLLSAAFTAYIGAGSASAIPASLGFMGFVIASGLALTTGIVLAAFVRLYASVFLGLPRSQKVDTATEVNGFMRWPMGFLALTSVILGIIPSLSFKLFEPVLREMNFTSVSALSVLEPKGTTALILAAPLVLACVLAGLMKKKAGKAATGSSETWNCGGPMEPQMQYSAGGYSQHFSRGFGYKPVFDSKVYRPIRNAMVWTASSLRSVQSGSVQVYLAYVMATLLILIAISSRL